MSQVPEQLSGLSKEAIDAALSFAQVSMQSADRLLRLQLEAAKSFVAEQTQTAKALADTKDPEAMAALRARLAEQAVERAIGFSRNVYEVATDAQQQLTRLVSERVTSSQQQITSAMESMLKSAPGGSNAAVEAMRSTMSATQTAMESMTKAAKQAADFAEANVKAVTEAATAAIKAPKKKQ